MARWVLGWLLFGACAGTGSGQDPGPGNHTDGAAGLADDDPSDTDPAADTDGAASYLADPPPTPYQGCVLMPADTVFHADVRALPVHPRSDAWKANLGLASSVHLPATPDTTYPWAPVVYGVPHTLADASTPRRKVIYDGFYDVSSQFPGPFPLPAGLDVQTGFDQQTIILQTDTCGLYELIGYANILAPTANGGSYTDLRAHGPGAERWSVTAPRFPLLPIQVRTDEIAAGRIDHVLAVSHPWVSSAPPVWPAMGTDGRSDEEDAPPMGAWMRLRADVDTSSMPPAIQILARAMKVHGLLLADTGGGEGRLVVKLQKSATWKDASGQDLIPVLRTLQQHITVDDLEFVDPTPMQRAPDSWRIR